MKKSFVNRPINAEEQYDIGFCYLVGIGVKKDFRQALHWMKQSTKQGHIEAIRFLKTHLESLGLNYNLNEFIHCDGLMPDFNQTKYQAEQGDKDAQNVMGLHYGLNGPEKDYGRASYWFRKASEQGHAVAQQMLSSCYRQGRGVPKDEKQAMYWLRESAKNGNEMSKKLLEHLTNGGGFPYLLTLPSSAF